MKDMASTMRIQTRHIWRTTAYKSDKDILINFNLLMDMDSLNEGQSRQGKLYNIMLGGINDHSDTQSSNQSRKNNTKNWDHP